MNEKFNHNNANKNIASLLKAIIDSRGLRYRFVAKMTGIDYQRLMRILHGRSIMSAAELFMLYDVVGIELPYPNKEIAQ